MRGLALFTLSLPVITQAPLGIYRNCLQGPGDPQTLNLSPLCEGLQCSAEPEASSTHIKSALGYFPFLIE